MQALQKLEDPGSANRRWRMRCWLVLVVLCAWGSRVGAQSEAPSGRGLQLTVPVQETLSRIEEQWLVWNSSFLQGDREQAEGAIRDLRATSDGLGMSSLPDLSRGILVRAVEAAREGDVERAGWALDMAEQLDTGRPETAFARSRVALIDGAYAQAVLHHLLGYARLFGHDLQRSLWLRNVVLWIMASLLVTGAVYVALQMATKGLLLFRDLTGFLAGHLPSFAAYLLAVAILAWPFLLPRAWIWLLLYWAALLWPYGSKSERWVLGVVLVVFGVAPVVVLEQQRSIEVGLSKPMRAIESLAAGRLYGGAFRDLGALRAALPESDAVSHMIADLHTSLGQDQLARSRYVSLIEKEPENTGAMINLGTYYYHRREYIKAIENFKKAAEVDPGLLAAHFNLSQAYRALLEFSDADEHLERARLLDADQVNEWITQTVNVVRSQDGLRRQNEIRAQLMDVWREETGSLQGLMGRARSLPMTLGTLALAIVLFVLRRGRMPKPEPPREETFIDHWSRILVPGLVSLERGNGVRACFAVMVPVAALLLPYSGMMGYRIPWGYDAGNLLAWIITAAVLVLYAFFRFRFAD